MHLCTNIPEKAVIVDSSIYAQKYFSMHTLCTCAQFAVHRNGLLCIDLTDCLHSMHDIK